MQQQPQNTKENENANVWFQSGFEAPGKQRGHVSEAVARPYNPRGAVLANRSVSGAEVPGKQLGQARGAEARPLRSMGQARSGLAVRSVSGPEAPPPSCRNSHAAAGPSAPAATPLFLKGAQFARRAVVKVVDEGFAAPDEQLGFFEEQVGRLEEKGLDPPRPPQLLGNPRYTSSGLAPVATDGAALTAPSPYRAYDEREPRCSFVEQVDDADRKLVAEYIALEHLHTTFGGSSGAWPPPSAAGTIKGKGRR